MMQVQIGFIISSGSKLFWHESTRSGEIYVWEYCGN